MTGPPVQDLWLILPDHPETCPRELELLIEGYRRFRDFDRGSLRLIEPLRLMRMIYFLAWCARQTGDFKFQANFPEWGSAPFWRRETADLARQLAATVEYIRRSPGAAPPPSAEEDAYEFWDM
jgi:Ser/Thr protein kinase RdoA (MazF antagonist)